MKWIRSAGGPLLLLGEDCLAKWGGVVGPTTGGSTDSALDERVQITDYDRACRVEAYLGRIPVGSEDALVFGGEPMDTGWIRFNGSAGGIVVRWMFAECEHEVLESLGEIPEALFRPEGVFVVSNAKYLLFDAALAGRNVERHPAEYESIELAPGCYQIHTAVYARDDRFYLVVHRFAL